MSRRSNCYAFFLIVYQKMSFSDINKGFNRRETPPPKKKPLAWELHIDYTFMCDISEVRYQSQSLKLVLCNLCIDAGLMLPIV